MLCLFSLPLAACQRPVSLLVLAPLGKHMRVPLVYVVAALYSLVSIDNVYSLRKGLLGGGAVTSLVSDLARKDQRPGKHAKRGGAALRLRFRPPVAIPVLVAVLLPGLRRPAATLDCLI